MQPGCFLAAGKASPAARSYADGVIVSTFFFHWYDFQHEMVALLIRTGFAALLTQK